MSRAIRGMRCGEVAREGVVRIMMRRLGREGSGGCWGDGADIIVWELAAPKVPGRAACRAGSGFVNQLLVGKVKLWRCWGE